MRRQRRQTRNQCLDDPCPDPERIRHDRGYGTTTDFDVTGAVIDVPLIVAVTVASTV
jgi:hypothetical protein